MKYDRLSVYRDLPGTVRMPGADWIICKDDIQEVALGFLDAIAPQQGVVVTGVSCGGYSASSPLRSHTEVECREARCKEHVHTDSRRVASFPRA